MKLICGYRDKNVFLHTHWEGIGTIRGNVLPIPRTKAVWIILGSDQYILCKKKEGRKEVKGISGMACNSQEIKIIAERISAKLRYRAHNEVFSLESGTYFQCDLTKKIHLKVTESCGPIKSPKLFWKELFQANQYLKGPAQKPLD